MANPTNRDNPGGQGSMDRDIVDRDKDLDKDKGTSGGLGRPGGFGESSKGSTEGTDISDLDTSDIDEDVDEDVDLDKK